MSRATIIVLLCSFSCLRPGIASCGEAPWYVPYDQGLREQERGEWQASLAALSQALAEKPHSQLKARTYGLWFVDYLPHYHMAIAYARLGDRQNALRQVALEQDDGAIREAPDELERMQRLSTELGGVPPEPSAPEKKAPATESQTARQDSLVVGRYNTIQQPSAPIILSPEGTPSQPQPAGLAWYASYDAALAYIESRDWMKAVESLKAAVEARPAPDQFARTYGMWFLTYVPYYYLGLCYYHQGLWQYAAKYLEMSQRLGELSGMQAEQDTTSELLERAKRHVEDSSAKPSVKGARELLTAGIADAVRLYNLQRYDEAETGFRTILKLDPYNSVARDYLEKLAVRGGGSSVSAAAMSDFLAGTFEYYKGNYDAAIASFRSVQASYSRDATFHAFLGAALVARAGRTKDQSVLQQAREAFARVQELDPAYRLDRRLFSGEARKLFRDVQERRKQK